MRIIAGTLGSRQLKTVSGEGYRPAMGKVRESVFSMLEHRLGGSWQGLRVCDLFAGSGSLAFEALSRGAEGAWFVENAPQAARCIKENIRTLSLEERAFLVQEDVLRVLRRVKGADRLLPTSFHLVFLDPPYHKHLAQSSLDALVAQHWLENEAFVLLEIEARLTVSFPSSLRVVADKLFGQTRIVLLQAELDL